MEQSARSHQEDRDNLAESAQRNPEEEVALEREEGEGDIGNKSSNREDGVEVGDLVGIEAVLELELASQNGLVESINEYANKGGDQRCEGGLSERRLTPSLRKSL